jgi:CheY-like chemotaxis protein
MTRRILFVDDDSDDTELFCEALSAIDPAIDCICASEGQDALDKLDKLLPELPDVIFLDINMPGMNGWECLGKLKSDARYKSLPVIIYSTSSHHRDMEIAMSMGALCFFSKPTDYKELQKNLRFIIHNIHTNSLVTIAEAFNGY